MWQSIAGFNTGGTASTPDKTVGLLDFAARGINGTRAFASVGNVPYVYTARSNAAAGYAGQGVAGVRIHGLLDPSRPVPIKLRYRDRVICEKTAGNVYAYCGFFFFNVTADFTSLVGVGFHDDKADNTWQTFVYDSPTDAAPSTSRHNDTLVAQSTTSAIMEVEIDGMTSTITWRINGTVVDTYTMNSKLQKTGATLTSGTPLFTGGGVFTEAGVGNNGRLNQLGGGNMALVAIAEAT